MSRNNRTRHGQSHAPRETRQGAMTHVSVQGVDVTVDATLLDDWELMESLYALQDGDALQIVPVMRRLLGDATYRQVKDRLRDPQSGRVNASRMSDWLTELFRQLSPNS